MTTAIHRVGIIGAAGRMGTATRRAVDAADDMTVAATVGRGQPMEALLDGGATVAVDFTRPDVAEDHIGFAIDHGLNCVVGTSGFDTARIDRVRAGLEGSTGVGVMIVPNFAIGAVLAARFARQVARFFPAAEIIEMHHAGKADAPSGTALAAAAGIGAARDRAGLGPMPDATRSDPDGARGAVVDGVHVHAVRLPGLVAHLEVMFGGEGETLTIRHDSLTRESFMSGVLMAIRAVASRPGLTVGLEPLLDAESPEPPAV